MASEELPASFRAAVAAEFRRAARPPYEIPLVVACNGMLVVLFWFSPLNSVVFSLHGAMAFPVVLGSWMYADVPATNVLGSDRHRALASLEDRRTLMRILAARMSLLWLLIAPGCVFIAVIIGVAEQRFVAILWTVIAIALLPLGALAISQWVGIIWPYVPISLRSRWHHRREVRSQLRWLVLILLPYVIVPAVFVLVGLGAFVWWYHSTGGVVGRVSDALLAQLVLISSATSLVVWFGGRAGTRWLLRRRRDNLADYLANEVGSEQVHPGRTTPSEP